MDGLSASTLRTQDLYMLYHFHPLDGGLHIPISQGDTGTPNSWVYFDWRREKCVREMAEIQDRIATLTT